MNRSKIVGQVPLLHGGRVPAVLDNFELESDALAFNLEVPLSSQLISALTRTPGAPRFPDHSAPPDAVLYVSLASATSTATSGLVTEARLYVPARGQAVGSARVRVGQPPGELELDPVRCSINGTRWVQRLSFRPLPDDGDLTFRLTSQLFGIATAVGVVTAAKLRSRVI